MRHAVALSVGLTIVLSQVLSGSALSTTREPPTSSTAQPTSSPNSGAGHQLVRGVRQGRGPKAAGPAIRAHVSGLDTPQAPTPPGYANNKIAGRFLKTTSTSAADRTLDVTETAEVPSAPILGDSFGGMFGTGAADPTMAVGPHQVVIATNLGYAAFGKDGTPVPNTQLCAGSCSLPEFFTNALVGANIFDPWLLYDQYIGRYWFIAVSQSESPRNSDLLIGMSNSNDIVNGWSLFAVDARKNANDVQAQWCDYPKLGIDAQAIYLTCNMFSFPLSEASFQYAKIRVMTKQQFVDDTCCYWWDWWNLVEIGPGFFSDHSYTIQPAHMYGATAENGMYLVNAMNQCGAICPPQTLVVRHVRNPQVCCVPGHQQEPDKLDAYVAVGAMEDPPDAHQPGGAAGIYTQDNRLLNAIWQDGRLSTVQNIKCPDANSVCVAFTEMDVSSMYDIHLITDMVVPPDGSDRYFPSVDVNAAGNKTMVYTRSSASEFASAMYIGIPSGFQCQECLDGPETMLQPGGNTFVNLDGRGHNRWGDFMGSAADPDGVGIWIHAEYASSTQDVWGTAVGLTYEQPDATPPTTTAALVPLPTAFGWNKAAVTVTLSATDAESGVRRITYSATGAQTVPSTVVSGATASFIVTPDGDTTVAFFAEDNWGNVEATKTQVVRIDKVPPVVACDATDGIWHASDVSITCNASDALSGLASSADTSFSISTNVPVETETSDACTAAYVVLDRAGTARTAGPVCGNKVDKKAPVISVTTPLLGAVYLLNQTVTASYSCSDGGSGVATCAGPVTSGAPIDTSSIGTKTFTVVGKDNVGNTRSLSVTYVVTYNVCLLYDPNQPFSGNAVPIRIALCDVNRVSASSPGVIVHATVVDPGAIAATSIVNPTNDFIYYAGMGGYTYILNTTGYASGTYELRFTVTGDPVAHSARFRLR